MKKQFVCILLALSLLLSLTACGSSRELTMDGEGYVTWKPIRKAVQYQCVLVDAGYTASEPFCLTEPGYRLPEGYCLHMQPVYADGSLGPLYTSDFYGTPVTGFDDQPQDTPQDQPLDPSVDQASLVNPNYDLTWDQLSCFELLSAIRPETAQTADDGTLTFEADGPNGTLRFEAQGVSLEDDQLVFQPGARLWSLDAIGRICVVRPQVADPGHPDNWIHFSGGYTFTDATGVSSHEELFYVWGMSIQTADPNEYYPGTDLMDYQPNFLIFGSETNSQDAFRLSSLEIYYDTATFNTGIRAMCLDSNFYGTYLPGDRYDPAREVYDPESKIYTFYLGAVPELQNELTPFTDFANSVELSRAIINFYPDQYQIGQLRHADGTVADPSEPLEIGATLDVTIGDYTCPVALPVSTPYQGAQNMHELVPYCYPEATGSINTVLVPVTWQDQPENATDEALLQLKAWAGRVLENGTAVDYSDRLAEDKYSLSAYYDIVSYGSLTVNTFVTDWFTAPFDYSTYKDMSCGDEAFLEAACQWLAQAYPDTDWSAYDKDANGYFDSVILINVGTSNDDYYTPSAFSGGTFYLQTYNGGAAGTAEAPAVNCYINVNASILEYNTLIHEFGHNLGLIDYYDVGYTGIDAVGQFDMQSGSYGDWNAYSKYAAGWITPTVADLAPGQSMEYTIGAFCDTGDALVIPVHADTFDGPFNEYILIDLFTDGGVNTADAEYFGLQNTSGLRIWHVDSRMETHVETENGVEYTLGTPTHTNAYAIGGDYFLELMLTAEVVFPTPPLHEIKETILHIVTTSVSAPFLGSCEPS